MKFNEWSLESTILLAEFIEYWTRKNKENPQMFPLEMKSGDWDEQYNLYKLGVN